MGTRRSHYSRIDIDVEVELETPVRGVDLRAVFEDDATVANPDLSLLEEERQRCAVRDSTRERVARGEIQYADDVTKHVAESRASPRPEPTLDELHVGARAWPAGPSASVSSSASLSPVAFGTAPYPSAPSLPPPPALPRFYDIDADIVSYPAPRFGPRARAMLVIASLFALGIGAVIMSSGGALDASSSVSVSAAAAPFEAASSLPRGEALQSTTPGAVALSHQGPASQQVPASQQAAESSHDWAERIAPKASASAQRRAHGR